MNTFITDLYDRIAADHPEGIKLSEIKEMMEPEVIDYLETQPRSLKIEARSWINGDLESVRGRRSQSLRQSLEYILDGFAEDGTYIDPLLDHAFSLGQNGVDKVLRFWTARDFQDLVVTRYRVAADATHAAAEVDRSAQRAVDLMDQYGAGVLGDLFPTLPSEDAA